MVARDGGTPDETGEGFMGLFRTVWFMDETSSPAESLRGYLRLEELLTLQDGPEGYAGAVQRRTPLHHRSPTFELWFKLILRELKEARALMDVERIDEASIPHVVHHLERVSEIFRLLADQWKVMETPHHRTFWRSGQAGHFIRL